MRSLRPEHADPDVHPNLWHMRSDLGHERPCVALEQWWKEGGQGVELLGVRVSVRLLFRGSFRFFLLPIRDLLVLETLFGLEEVC